MRGVGRLLSQASLLVLLALAASAALAPGAAGQVPSVVILGNDYKIPKIYLDEQGRPSGILIDIARHIDRNMPGYHFDFRLFPWARAYAMAGEGQGGIIGLSKTEERLKLFDYSEVIFFDDVIVVVKKGREFDFVTLPDLRGRTVGVGRGGSFGNRFDQAVKSGLFRVNWDDGPVIRLRMLLAGRIDCALISPGRLALARTIAKDAMLREHEGEFVALPVPLRHDPNYLGFAKGMNMRGFLDEFNAVLRRERDNGEIGRILDRYFEVMPAVP